MRISGASAVRYTPAQQQSGGGSSSSSSALNSLQKQKMQIQDQMNEIKNSKLSSQEKDEKIKALQEQMQQIDKQIVEEQAKKLTEGTKASQKEQESSLEQEDENPQAINKNVMTGIITASSRLETGNTALSVYDRAKAKNDRTTMERALSYASSEFKKASHASKLIEKGMQEYRKQAGKANEPAAEAATPSGQSVDQTGSGETVAAPAAAVEAKPTASEAQEKPEPQRAKSGKIDLLA